MTAATLSGALPQSGLRPVHLRRDLLQIADLIELCFQGTLDESGRAALREMRLIGRSGPLIWLLNSLTASSPAWSTGFVWVEGGRVVGNIAVQRSGRRGEWLVANVAVHPDVRRRGIARALTGAALDLVRQQGGRSAILQVDANNPAATELYTRLGFQRETTHTHWTRRAAPFPDPMQPVAGLRRRRPGEWRRQYELAALVRPHGLAWNRPLAPGDFRPTLENWFARLFSGEWEAHWVIPGNEGLMGSLSLLTDLHGRAHLILLVHPARRGQLERPLLAYGLQRLRGQAGLAWLEHPSDDGAAGAALAELGFEQGRTLAWMRVAF